MSQAQLADAAGIGLRQIARYESGESEPTFKTAIELAQALGVSLAYLAGQLDHRINLDGTWWAGWQTFKDGQERIAVQEVEAHQQGDFVALTAERSRPVSDGGYSWTGEFRLWDNESLIGWYRGTDAAVRSKGAMYFALHTQGTHALGRWVGLSHDGIVITGHAVLARDQDQVVPLMEKLKADS